MVKADDGGLWPIGSQRKRAAINGVQYVQRAEKPFSQDRGGSSVLICAKDRNGTYHKGQKVARLVVEIAEGTTLSLTAAIESADVGPWRPTGYMEKISRLLENRAAPASFNDIDAAVVGKRAQKRLAVDRLIEDGYVSRTAGPNRSMLHASIKWFRESGNHPASEVGPLGDSRGSGPRRGTGNHPDQVIPGTTGEPVENHPRRRARLSASDPRR